jgi:predicted RNA binding protein YcfA (HicA-like mRNA interferase family)
MPKLPIVSGQEMIKKLAKCGYQVVRQKGSHVRLRNLANPLAKPLTVPLHPEIKAGLLHQIIKDAGLTIDQFTKL